ncbi:unnamed protein product [Mycena citricolor]|uniref:Uncharacterized protein n=1 Tax=Mycena citricolor TaxID=2018698 RepID=A0AAD2GXF5_9AGAR|nr:unnamed protein product [Mycena citricolor]
MHPSCMRTWASMELEKGGAQLMTRQMSTIPASEPWETFPSHRFGRNPGRLVISGRLGISGGTASAASRGSTSSRHTSLDQCPRANRIEDPILHALRPIVKRHTRVGTDKGHRIFRDIAQIFSRYTSELQSICVLAHGIARASCPPLRGEGGCGHNHCQDFSATEEI